MPKIVVLRLGHRIPRDARVTTHVCLTARAFGADGIIISDVVDPSVKKTVEKVVQDFGGDFFVEMGQHWREVVLDWQKEGGEVIHLTAYGTPISQSIEMIRGSPKDKLIVIGAEKVPGEVYGLASHNIAITNQPISEISALSTFLDWYFDRRELDRVFPNARIRIVPDPHGKKVVRTMEK